MYIRTILIHISSGCHKDVDDDEEEYGHKDHFARPFRRLIGAHI